MVVYHGSNVVVEQPMLIHQTRKLDFGAGFYVTTNKEQAKSFAYKVMKRTGTNSQFVSIYEFDFDSSSKELSILRFEQADEEWLEFVYRKRRGLSDDVQYDIIFGPVASDDIFRTFIWYETGAYTKEQTLEALKVKKLFDQLCFTTEKALSYLRYTGMLDLTGGA